MRGNSEVVSDRTLTIAFFWEGHHRSEGEDVWFWGASALWGANAEDVLE